MNDTVRHLKIVLFLPNHRTPVGGKCVLSRDCLELC